MARISDGVFRNGNEQLGMYLDRYAELMDLEPCGFNGVNKPTTGYDTTCVGITSQTQRDYLARYLLRAEQMREQELGFYMGYKWTTTEQHDMTGYNPFVLKWKHLVQVGAPTSVLIEADVALDYGTPPFQHPTNEPNDPVTISVTVDAAVPDSEIRVYYPAEVDEQRRIWPSAISRSGNTATISLPRCRLVKPEYNDDRDDPISYYDTDPFLTTVDVYRYYANESEGAKFVWLRTDCEDLDCEPNCQAACPMIIGPEAYRLSMVYAYPATYSSGSWTRSRCWAYTREPDFAQFAYLSGEISMLDEIATIQLAHTLMPRPPCTCDIIKDKWTSDNENMPRRLSPYGSKRGQIDAWVRDSRRVLGNGGMMLSPVLSRYPVRRL